MNKSEPKQKIINLNDSELEFINNKDANKALKVLSRVNFRLSKIHIENCNLNYNDINFLLNLFTDEMTYLYLANNNFLDASIFNKGGIYKNLQFFNLSGNNIENIDSLFTLDFPNLRELHVNAGTFDKVFHKHTVSMTGMNDLLLNIESPETIYKYYESKV